MRLSLILGAVLITAGICAPALARAQDAAPSTPTPGVLLAGSGIKVLSDGTVTATDPSQRARLQTAADGTLTWAYPVAFAAGVTPVVELAAEDTAGSTDVVTCKLDGAPTSTAAKVRCTRGVRTVVASLGGLVVANLVASPGALWLHLIARAP